MSKSDNQDRKASLHDVNVVGTSHKKHSQAYGDGMKNPKMSRDSHFVYVNNAYVGSTNSVNENRLPQPPTTVYQEQYWACSRWNFCQRILAVAVGVLLGAVIGLAVTIALKNGNSDTVIGGIFRSSAPD